MIRQRSCAVGAIISVIALTAPAVMAAAAPASGVTLPPAVAAPAQGTTLPPTIAARVLDPSIELDELRLRLVPLSRDELGAAAAGWFEILKSKTQELIDAQLALAGIDDAGAAAARDRVVGLSAERQSIADRLDAVLSGWELKGGDAEQVKVYRDYRRAVGIEQARRTDFRTLLQEVWAWLVSADGGVGFLIGVAVFAIAIAALMVAATTARRLTVRAVSRVEHVSKLLVSFLARAVYWMVLATGLLFVLSALGIDITPLFAVIGGASFIIAFAMQSTLSNVASGMLIMASRPFDEGDLVEIGDVLGTVRRVNIVSTTIATPDNKIVAVPNSQVWGNVITNYTGSETRRVDLVFGISYGDSIETAQRVLEETLARHPKVLREPEPNVQVSELADSSVNFIARPWVRQEDYWTVYWDLTRQVKEAFDDNGLSIPFPQRDVHLHNTTPPGTVTPDQDNKQESSS